MAEENTANNEKQTEDTKKKKTKKKRSLFHRIVNIFLYFVLGIVVLLLVVVAITQTSTFREFLRKTVIEQANANLNGTVYIEKIEGTIFTSLLLRNTVVNMGNDTLFKARVIELKTSPLQLLMKKIKVRSFEILNARVGLVSDSAGVFNITKLVPPSTDTTAAGEFPFTIDVASFKLTHVDFTMQRYDFVNSTASYDSLNMRDFRAKDINIDLSAEADINDNEYHLDLNHLSLLPNLNNINLKNLSGSFSVSPDEIFVDGLKLETDNSDVDLTVKLNNYDLFDSTGVQDIGDALIKAKINAGQLNLVDLKPFVPAVRDYNGSLTSGVELSGTVNNLVVNEIKLGYGNTQLALTGSIKGLMSDKGMYIRASFFDTYINPEDITALMPGLTIPGGKELGTLYFDTLTYEGTPKNFKTNLLLRTNKGTLSANGTLNMETPVMAYDLNLQTRNLDIAPFADMPSNLNIQAVIKGRGTKPEQMDANVNLIADGSVLDGNNLDTLRLAASAKNSLIDYKLITASDSMGILLDGNVDFTNRNNPAFNLDGRIRNLNVARFTKDSSSESNLNLVLSATGENFDPEQMNLYLNLAFYESTIRGIKIDSTRAIADLRRDDNGRRVINFISDLADISLIGNYSVPRTIELMRREADVLSSIANAKMNQVMPAAMETTNISTASILPAQPANYVTAIDSSTKIQYLVDLKNLDLLSLFLGDKRIEVDGDISGEINDNGDSLQVTLNAAVNYVKFWGPDDVFFLSNFNLDAAVTNQINASTLKDINAAVYLTTDRIFAGTDINNLSLSLELQNESARLDFSTLVEDYANAKITGGIDLSREEVGLALDTLRLTYNNYTLQNDSLINIAYSKQGVDIRSLNLVRGTGSININGNLAESGSQDLRIVINKLSGRDIASNLLMSRQDASFDALLNMDTKITGNSANPLMDINFHVDSVQYQGRNFGSLLAALDYKDRNLALDVKFVDSTITADRPALQIEGNVPVDLAFSGVEKRFADDADMQVNLKAGDFNLGAFGDLLPVVKKLRGSMAAQLTVTGSPSNLNPEGYVELKNAAFIVDKNNLEYNAAMKVTITKELVSLDNFTLKNADGTEGGGTMTGSGKAQLNNMAITSSQFSINGSLKVLDEVSKGASPGPYGTLIIATRGDIQFTADENGTKLVAPVTIKEANLTIPPSQSAYANNSANFIYKFVEDTTLTGGTGPDFETLIDLSKQRSAHEEAVAGGKETTFDYSIDLQIEDEATIIFVLSREINQNLTAVLGGKLKYESVAGKTTATGELRLLEGSTLEFIKTLRADGTIRFENELTDPYLDITATYLDYYYTDNSNTSESAGGNGSGGGQPNEVPVAVKIKVKGLLSELDKNFIQDENSIAVYYGQENIDNDTPDGRFDKSDAVYFILTGDFIGAASASSNTDFAQAQATSIAGSVLGGFLNRSFGDYVKSVELRKVGGDTKFNLSGRVNKFRYSIGGTQQVFQDLSQANVRIEYPLIEELLLRLERKQAITNESTFNSEMINELGLRYKFEF